jgi:PAS domain S-box-containing protein
MQGRILHTENYRVIPRRAVVSKPKTKIKILLVEDYEPLRQHLQVLLETAPDLEVVAVAGDGSIAVRLARKLSPQLVILSLGLNCIASTRQILVESPNVRVIVFSLLSDPRLALNLLKAGASAYLLKDRAFEELFRAVRDVMGNRLYLSPGITDTAIRAYLEARREIAAHFHLLFETAPLGVALLDQNGRLVEVNPSLEDMLGYRRNEMYQLPLWSFDHPGDEDSCLSLFRELAAGNRDSYQTDKRFIHQDGRLLWGCLTVSRVRHPSLESWFALASVENITHASKLRRRYGPLKRLQSLSTGLSGPVDTFLKDQAPPLQLSGKTV